MRGREAGRREGGGIFRDLLRRAKGQKHCTITGFSIRVSREILITLPIHLNACIGIMITSG